MPRLIRALTSLLTVLGLADQIHTRADQAARRIERSETHSKLVPVLAIGAAVAMFWIGAGVLATNPPEFAPQADMSPQGRRRGASAAPTPPVARIVPFHCAWTTAIGTAAGALRDSLCAPLPFTELGGNNQNDTVVVNPGGLDFPTTNVYRVMTDSTSPTVITALIQRLVSDSAFIPVTPVGSSRYYRAYWRVEMPDSQDVSGVFINQNGAPHPFQDGPAASTANWMFEVLLNNNGTWTPGFNVNFGGAVNPNPNNRWRANPLPKNLTVMLEVETRRVHADSFTLHTRIWDVAADTLLRSDSDFRNNGGSGGTTLVDSVSLAYGDTLRTRGFNAGNNGPSWAMAKDTAITMYWQGAVAICDDTWCGPYPIAGVE